MSEQFFDYINEHSEGEPLYLQRIARRAHVRLLNGRMVSGALQGRLLKMLAELLQPKNVLEIGTFVGYSALCIAEGAPQNAVIDTIEIDDELEDIILENFSTVDFGKKIVLHIGDALQIIETLDNKQFDLIFIDADKRDYLKYYQTVLPAVRSGGVILVDNTLWNGKVFEPPQSADSQTKAIIEFNDFLAADTRVEKIILPVRDGLTIIRKK
ncbi:MAG: O-methyltransferase [Prevotellaceae bacterium]|jgi:predicted O-methyltransferase YrrM|nr:O-methyltransferase [Prevotellaceae bacterium]